jgi:hypothetical protein
MRKRVMAFPKDLYSMVLWRLKEVKPWGFMMNQIEQEAVYGRIAKDVMKKFDFIGGRDVNEIVVEPLYGSDCDGFFECYVSLWVDSLMEGEELGFESEHVVLRRSARLLEKVEKEQEQLFFCGGDGQFL